MASSRPGRIARPLALVALLAASPLVVPARAARAQADGGAIDWGARLGLTSAPASDREKLSIVAAHGDYRFRHGGPVTHLLFTPDGSAVISAGSEPGPVKVWSVETGALLRVLGTHDGVAALGLTADGATAAVASGKTIRLFDVATGSERGRPFLHTAAVTAAAISPQGDFVVVATSDGLIRRWSIADRRSGRTIKAPGAVRLCVAPDGKRLAAGARDGSVRVRSVESGDVLREISPHVRPIDVLRWTAQGELFTSAAGESDLVWSSPDDGAERRRITWPRARMTAAAVSPDGKMAVANEGGYIHQLFDVGSGRELEKMRAPRVTLGASAAAFSPDGAVLVTAGPEGLLVAWDVAARKERLAPGGHRRAVRALAASADGARLATASAAGTVVVWSATDATDPVARLEGHRGEALAVAFSADGERLFSGGADARLRVWSVEGGAEVSADRCGSPVTALAALPDGETLVTGLEDGTVAFRRTDAAKVIERFALGGRVVALSVGGDHLAALAASGEVRLHDLREAKTKHALAGEHRGAVALTADGRQVAVALEGGGVVQRDVRTGEEVRVFEAHAGPVTGIAYTAKGDALVTVGDDGCVRIWDAYRGGELARLGLYGADDRPTCVAFLPDDVHVAIGTARGLAFVLRWER